MELAGATVERAVATWRAWAEAGPDGDTLSVVQIGGSTFVRVPDGLLDRVDTGMMRGARLSYADAGTLRPPASVNPTNANPTSANPTNDRLVETTVDDPRLARLQRATPSDEWWEAIVYPCVTIQAVVGDDGEFDAIGMIEDWFGIAAHIGVVTHPDRRGRGRGGIAAASAAQVALEHGLVPQWRARVGNDASQRLADRLGFVTLGIQLFVRIPRRASPTMGA